MADTTTRRTVDSYRVDPEIINPTPKTLSMRSIIKEFSLNTTSHGIPSIARSENIVIRIFWTIATLGFAGTMIYFIVKAISAYFEYPTQTSISVIFEWPQAFPAVTLCNYSPLVYERFIGPYLNYTNSMNLTNTMNTTIFYLNQSYYIRDFINYKFNRGDSVNDFFFPLEGMMMSCLYNGMVCSSANFTWFLSPMYGLCYTFNANMKGMDGGGIAYNADNGGNGVFEVSLFTHRHQYVPYISNAVGFVVLVHDNAQIPMVEMAGMYLSPGRHHKLSYTKKISQFLPTPYSECKDKVNLGLQLMFNEFHGADYKYSRYNCVLVCMQSYIYEHCGCGHPFYWNVRSIVLPNSNKAMNISFCDIRNPCYNERRVNFMNTESIWTNYCFHCTPECFNTDFIIKSSSLSAPVEYLLDDIKSFVESSNISISTSWNVSWISEIQTNYVSLEVAYETIRTDVYAEQATISPVDVISNVGGQTGLWIGISFLSLMELVEMIFQLAYHRFYLQRKASKQYDVQNIDNINS